MTEAIELKCEKCGHVYRAMVANSQPDVCGCGVPYRAEVTFTSTYTAPAARTKEET